MLVGFQVVLFGMYRFAHIIIQFSYFTGTRDTIMPSSTRQENQYSVVQRLFNIL